MAEAGGRDLFRKKSLERLSSPERLDHLLQVADRKTWMPLLTAGLLVMTALVWAVFDQKGAFLEGEWGAGRELIPRVTLKLLLRELPKIRTVLDVLSVLEKGETDQLARVLHWSGYPIPNEQT